MKYFDSFYVYLLKAIYYGAVPSIVLYGKSIYSKIVIIFVGLFSKPYSPLMLAFWSYITGQE